MLHRGTADARVPRAAELEEAKALWHSNSRSPSNAVSAYGCVSTCVIIEFFMHTHTHDFMCIYIYNI